MNWRDIWQRCYKTFVQAFIPVFGASVVSAFNEYDYAGEFSWAVAKPLILGVLLPACATGICAVWNALLGRSSEDGFDDFGDTAEIEIEDTDNAED